MKSILLLTTICAVALIASCGQNPEENSRDEFELTYEKFTLDNGLEVVLHEDHSDPIVAVATLMHVGSNREKPGRTGFAHFFEHMSFNDSENVPRGANRKLIPEWGGQRNGGTWSDGTIYYEVVPKDAFDKILWIDSDRFGYMINTVTEEALEREKQVVKNEKRERVDNSPYGFTDEIIRKNLYPEGHPYSWTVIGSLPDLQAATLADVKEFYNQYYGAGNATVVIAGDIDIEETKIKVKQWFGEIPEGPKVESMGAMPANLSETKSLYFEDNFARLPELRMVFPSPEQYHPDTYALDVLGNLLSGSKKSVLYKSIVEAKLAPNVYSYLSSNELASEFVFSVRANSGVDLDSVKVAIEAGLKDFEENGFTDNELLRIKAELETNLYGGVSTVLNKAFRLVTDNEFKGDPGFLTKRAKLMQEVSQEDVMRVYNQYIKDKHYVMTSVVPKDQTELIVDGADQAEVYIEEVVAEVANEEVSQGDEAEYDKTETQFDRSEPDFGELPLFKSPEVWTSSLNNGLNIYGIENHELPLVSFDLTLQGGHWQDPMEKSGVASLLGDLLLEGTASKTPAELEEAIGLLGATINTRVGQEGFVIQGSCLARNFEKTLSIMQEILLEPRWDSIEYDRLKKSLITSLKGREANPRSVAYNVFTKLIFGDNHIMGTPSNGTLETAESITIEDLKSYYSTNFSPTISDFHVVGAVKQDRVMKALVSLNQNWEAKEVKMATYESPTVPDERKLYFIDIPGSKQSVIYIGMPALSGMDLNANNLDYANEKIGGGSSGELFQVLRIEKGYTYGAYSYIQGFEEVSPYTVYTSVRTNATLPSLEIIKDMVQNYADNFTEKDVEMTRNKVLKASTRDYEGLSDKLSMLHQISKLGKDPNYMEIEQKELTAMTLDDYKNVINKYIQEDKMIYLIVGDGATQLTEVKKLGLGDPIMLDIYGDPVTM